MSRYIRRLTASWLGPMMTLVRYRDLLNRLVRRDVVARTSGTVLGGLWLIAQPALQVLAFWFLLDFVLKVRAPGRVLFIDYFLIAMLPWLFIQETLSRNLAVLTEFAGLYQRTRFPVTVLPLVPLIMATVVFAPVYAGVSGLLLGVGGFLKAWVVILLLAVWLLPFCYLLALLGLFFRESRQVFPFVLTMVLYLTPILYQPDALPDHVKPFLAYNVVADIVAVIQHWMHQLPDSPGNYMRPLLVWLLLMPPAWALYLRAEPHMREEL